MKKAMLPILLLLVLIINALIFSKNPDTDNSFVES